MTPVVWVFCLAGGGYDLLNEGVNQPGISFTTSRIGFFPPISTCNEADALHHRHGSSAAMWKPSLEIQQHIMNTLNTIILSFDQSTLKAWKQASLVLNCAEITTFCYSVSDLSIKSFPIAPSKAFLVSSSFPRPIFLIRMCWVFFPDVWYLGCNLQPQYTAVMGEQFPGSRPLIPVNIKDPRYSNIHLGGKGAWWNIAVHSGLHISLVRLRLTTFRCLPLLSLSRSFCVYIFIYL